MKNSASIAIAAFSFFCVYTHGAEKVFVKDGVAKAVHYVGDTWKSENGYLEGVGKNTRLMCDYAIGEGDFHIKAELSIPHLNRWAQELGIGQFSHIGLDINGGRIILNGPLFVPDEQMIRYSIIGRNTEVIKAGKPFLLEVVRKGDEITFSFDGKPYHTARALRAHTGPVSVWPGKTLNSECVIRVHNLSAKGRLYTYQTPKNMLPSGVMLDSRVKCNTDLPLGALSKMPDGAIMRITGGDLRISHDNGRTWDNTPIVISSEAKEKVGRISSAIPVCTDNGVIIAVFTNQKTREPFEWDDEKRTATSGRIDVWVARSVDNGKTWIDIKPLYEGYCGALIDAIQTSGGSIVVPVQEFMFDVGRTGTRSYVSNDDGKTWRKGNLLDIGGSGNHEGAFEPTITELPDGRTWMLMRTNLDYLWEAFSDNTGLYWREVRLSKFDASSSPAFVTKLESGRLMLAWNRLYPEGKTSYRRRIGKWSESPCSWHRGEVSVAFSDTEGKNWTEPVVIARKPGGEMAYLRLFEYQPGKIWLFAGGLGLQLELNEADFVSK